MTGITLHRLRVLTLISCIACTLSLNAQSKVYHERFTANDGLEIDKIQGLVQDHLGYLWIGGENLDSRDIVGKSGSIHLQRFDGKSFHNMKPTSPLFYGDIKKLTAYQGSKLILHHKNKETDFKLSLLDASTFKMLELDMPDNGNMSDVRFINGVYYAINIVGTTVELFYLDENLNFNFLFSFENDVKAVATDDRTVLMLHNEKFIFSDDNFPITITDKKGKLLKRFSYEGFNRSRDHISSKLWIEEAFTINDKFYAFMRDSDTLYLLNENNLEFEPVESNLFNGKNDITTFADPLGNALIAYTKNELLHLATVDQKNHVHHLYSHSYESQLGLRIWSKDIKDQVWVSIGNELHYYKFPNSQFESFLIDKEIRAIKNIGGSDFIIATEMNGWYLYNHQSKDIKPFMVYENNIPFFLDSSRNIFIRQDTLWSNSKGSMVAIHRSNGGSRSYNYFPAQCMEEIDDSTFIYGTENLSLMKFNRITKKHSTIIRTDSLNIFDLALNSNKEWVVAATQNGILTHHLQDKTTAVHNLGLNDPFFLMADYYKDTGFLLGTRDGKIIKFNPVSQRYDILYQDELKAGIATITPYKKHLWISTFNGLVQYDTLTGYTRRYSIKDGLSHNEGNRYSAAVTSDGILIGSLKGVNHFRPNELLDQPSQDSLKLLKIRKFDVSKNKFIEIFDQSAFAKAEPITLPIENKSLELEFSLTGLDLLRNETYEYQINDEEWNDLKDEKSLQLYNLAAGAYNLKIRAKDFSGKILGAPLSLSIISQDFVYNTWWFYVLMFSIIASLIIWWIRTQRANNKMQIQFSQDLIQNREEERSRIAKELHDSVGQHLTLIKQTAQNKNLTDIASLTHITLEEIRSISRNIYPATLHRLGFKSSVEQLLEDIDNQTSMFVDSEIENVDPFMDEKTMLNLYRFIQEAVSNVIKHAHSKTLQVKITAHERMISIYIMDNGRGFEEKADILNQSLGFKTLKERINIVNGSLEIRSTLGKGTELFATIPKIK